MEASIYIQNRSKELAVAIICRTILELENSHTQKDAQKFFEEEFSEWAEELELEIDPTLIREQILTGNYDRRAVERCYQGCIPIAYDRSRWA